MIQVSQISKSYGAQLLFEDVSFTIGDGERIGLVGRNGSGKTTLLRMLAGIEDPDSGTVFRPQLCSVGWLKQHLEFRQQTVLAEACESLPVQEGGWVERHRAEVVLDGLGFSPEQLQMPPTQLSSGFQLRLHLAKVLVGGPQLLLLDEPTNYLDVVSIRWLQNFLRSWRGEMVIVTHDRGFMNSVTTHTLGIHRRKVRKIEGSSEKLYEQIVQEEQVYEQTRQNEDRKREQIERFINRFRAQATRARAVQSRIKALSRQEKLQRLEEIDTLDFRFAAAPFPAKWLMHAENVGFSYDPAAPRLFSNLSFSVANDDRLAVIGPNGLGKSTLLKLLAGELSPREGGLSRHEALRAGFFGQAGIESLSPKHTVEEEIGSVNPELSRSAVRNICGAMMFEEDHALKPIGVLSGGERSRVLLGKILVSPVNLLLLDEPTNHLDMESIDSLISALDTFEGAVVLVTHSEMVLRAVARRLIVFDGGEAFVFEGTYDEFLGRIGWRGERGGADRVPESGGESTVPANRKELRRLRAEVIAERSRVLKPLQERMQAAEEEIIGLEEAQERNQALMLEAVEARNGAEISRLSKALHDDGESIERLFEELHRLERETTERGAEFDSRLQELGGEK